MTRQQRPSLLVPPSGPVTAHCIRLHPGDTLKSSLEQAAAIILARIPRHQCGSVFVITAVGSLQDVTIRLANAARVDNDGGNAMNGGNDIKRYQQRFEVVSLTGTFSRDDGCHIHISLADAAGNAIGGHLMEGTVFTTCEIVLATADGVEFVREMDGETGYKELVPLQMQSDHGGGGLMWSKVAMALAIATVGFIGGRYKSR